MHPLPRYCTAFPTLRASLAATACVALAACGGGNSGGTSGNLAPLQTHADAVVLDLSVLPPSAATQQAQPTFHTAPVEMNEPGDEDAYFNGASASHPPALAAVPSGAQGIATRGLTLEGIRSMRRGGPVGGISTTAAPKVVTTYTPAQIRAAYGMPAVAAAGVTPTAAQAAQAGAGQTVYIVDAMHDPNAAAELAAFNAKFGLPACTTKTLSPTTALPLPAPPAATCDLYVVYSTASGARTAAAPAYDSGWATEIALDVQWVHATAPLARIVLIEAPDSSVNSLAAAVGLANAMGPGAVSMSFGAAEGSWTSSMDTAFGNAQMSYLAATGDNGAGVSWPAVSARVLAVGGTSLTATGGTRSETTWSGSGGGVSQFTALPTYQSNKVPGMGTLARRSVADVAFNADPYTGQYVAVIAPGSTSAGWLSAGGTSLSTPQWAGLVAIVNAVRAQSARTALGDVHATLYTTISIVPGNYANAFADVTTGSDGSCATCVARVGYDTPTGLGTPNVTGLVAQLAGQAPAPAPAPTPAPAPPAATGLTITAPAMKGTAGKPLSSPISISDVAGTAVSVSISGVPPGMGFSVNGLTITANWPNPSRGNASLSILATDTSGRSARATVPVTIN